VHTRTHREREKGREGEGGRDREGVERERELQEPLPA